MRTYSYTGAQLDRDYLGIGGNCQNWSSGSPSSSGTWKLRLVYGVGNPLGVLVSLLPGVSTSDETLQLATGRVQFSGTRGQLFCNINNVFRSGDFDKDYTCAWTN